MKHLTLTLFVALTLLAFALPADAQIREVDCNGSTPYPDVNSALVGATPGTTIVVHPCSYNTGFTIAGMTNIEVVSADVGAGMIGAWEVGLGTTPPAGPLFVDVSSSCVVIKDSQEISIVGLDFEYCRNDGFTIDKSLDVLIDGNTAYSADGNGAAIYSGGDIDLVGNHFRYAKRNGVETFPAASNVRVTRNRLEGNNFGIVMRGDYLDVVGNEIVDGENTGITVQSDYSTVSRNTVSEPFSGAPPIDFSATPLGTCVVGNDLFGAGVLAPPGACEAENF